MATFPSENVLIFLDTSGINTYIAANPTGLADNLLTSFIYFTRKRYLMRTQVATYSGHRLHERPLRFLWEEQWLEVREILEQGYSPGSLFFKVVAADDRAYLLQYQEGTDSWEARVCATRPHHPA